METLSGYSFLLASSTRDCTGYYPADDADGDNRVILTGSHSSYSHGDSGERKLVGAAWAQLVPEHPCARPRLSIPQEVVNANLHLHMKFQGKLGYAEVLWNG